MPKEKMTLARPYAEAVFQLAQEQESLDTWEDELDLLAQIAMDPQLLPYLSNPRFSRHRQVELLLAVAEDKISAEGVNFVKVLGENRRLDLLSEIVSLYRLRKRELDGLIRVQVTSAYPLQEAEKSQLVQALAARFHCKIEIDATEDAALLAGAVIRAGDVVIDGSVSGQLQRLTQSMGT